MRVLKVAQNLKGGENAVVSASPVRSVVGVQPPTPTTTSAPSVEDELRTRLSASQLRIVQLAAEVHRLNLKVSIFSRQDFIRLIQIFKVKVPMIDITAMLN